MRKLILFTTCLLLSVAAFAQNKLADVLPVTDGEVIYSNVVHVDGVNKEMLYNRAMEWFVKNYKSSKVIQLEDRDNGNIIGKGIFAISYFTRDPEITHTISISVKDGRYKYSVSHFYYSDVQKDRFSIEDFPSTWAGKTKLYKKLDEKVLNLIASLEKAMKTDADNW